MQIVFRTILIFGIGHPTFATRIKLSRSLPACLEVHFIDVYEVFLPLDDKEILSVSSLSRICEIETARDQCLSVDRNDFVVRDRDGIVDSRVDLRVL